jgi:hypothetical protein
LKAPEALAGMHERNCKLIVVKPERRGGYMPSQVKISAPQGSEATRHPDR